MQTKTGLLTQRKQKQARPPKSPTTPHTKSLTLIYEKLRKYTERMALDDCQRNKARKAKEPKEDQNES
jgi:hypothetical protein